MIIIWLLLAVVWIVAIVVYSRQRIDAKTITRYDRPAVKQSIRCSECGRRINVRYNSQTMCGRCFNKKHFGDPKSLVTLHNGLTITKEVEKRLRRIAERDIPKSGAETAGDWIQRWGMLFCWASGYFVARAISDAIFPSEEWTALFWFVMLAWCFGLPLVMMEVIDRILANPRNEREERIKTKTIELAQERKRRQEDAESFYSSPEWSSLRKRVIDEDERVCAMCRKKLPMRKTLL